MPYDFVLLFCRVVLVRFYVLMFNIDKLSLFCFITNLLKFKYLQVKPAAAERITQIFCFVFVSDVVRVLLA